jgi:hypothetical protein
MSSLTLQDFIVNSGTNELFYDGNVDGERVICWTRLCSDTFILAATNGFDIWKATFEKQDLSTQCELSEVENLEKFLDVMKYAFDSSSVSLVKVGKKIILQCSGQKTAINFDLFEAKINDKKSELQYMFFHLTDEVRELKKSLTEAKDELEKGRQRDQNGSAERGFGFEPARKAVPGVNQRRKLQGSSLLNPNSKKAKKAKGISFE